VILKDNLTFGVKERCESFCNKFGEEEKILNREACAS
jgi:hypothetical protein